MLELLAAAGTTPHAAGTCRSTSRGPDIVTYAELIERIRDALMVRPRVLSLAPLPV